MERRNRGIGDRLLSGADNALRTLLAPPRGTARPSPAGEMRVPPLSGAEQRHAAGLMRVNHAGEIAAQGLYQGHAAVARDELVAADMHRAAAEEIDHLRWCAERLQELGSSPSRLAPVWYAGAYAIGAISGLAGDRWSLGFIAETERQVVQHLNGHLEKLPASDSRSRAILERMAEEEAVHGAEARAAGGAELPPPLQRLMAATARIMTRTAYWF